MAYTTSPLFNTALRVSGLQALTAPTDGGIRLRSGPAAVARAPPRVAGPPSVVAAAALEPKWDARYAGAVPHDTNYYMKCMLGGILSCGLTHTAVTPYVGIASLPVCVRAPFCGCLHWGCLGGGASSGGVVASLLYPTAWWLTRLWRFCSRPSFLLSFARLCFLRSLDNVKCNMQVNPKQYPGLVSGFRVMAKEQGSMALWKGWAPTWIGYSAQGLFKFGLYEVFKDLYANMAGEENATKYRGLIWCAGSASAEFFADIALCPMEMVKVKVQTSPFGAWPTGLTEATRKMNAQKAETRFPFGSLGPLWSRQIPYTVAKFFFFEKCVSTFYTYVFTAPKNSYSKSTQLGITTMSGYAAGVICAVVSHPADSMVSQLGKAENKGKPLGAIAKEVGVMNLFTKGLGARILMIGTLTSLQWVIYDSFKTAMGMGTTGGK